MRYFIFSVNERVVVIMQSIMLLPVEKQYELSLIRGILLKHQISFRLGKISKKNNENSVCLFFHVYRLGTLFMYIE